MNEENETTGQVVTQPGAGSICKIAAALAKAQSAFLPIVKDKVARINSSKGSYEYRYADLSSVLAAIRPALASNELSVIQTTELDSKGYVLVTTLLHSSGQVLSSRLRLSDWPDPKQLGIEMTYLRRYALCALVGVASEDDSDSDGLDTKARGRAGKQQPEASEPRGLSEGVRSKLLDDIRACEDSEALTKVYAEAYRTAQQAQDRVAAGEFLSAYRQHPKYVAPAPKQRAVT